MSKGQIVGFAALGALLLLVGVSIYSSREEGSGPSPLPVTATAPATPKLTEALPSMPGPGSVVSATVEDVALSPQARLLAERFQCVCGCKDILATCSCKETPGSRDMKKYLQELVDQKKSPSEIQSAMIARYGDAVIP